VSTIDGAEALRGLELSIPAAEVPALAEGRYYLHDLVGCAVETMAGERVGEVVAVERGVTTLLVVRRGTVDVLVPFVEEICREIDVVRRRIRVDPPDGLLDL
jgi:16S rRNA processing protein RimM